MYESTIYKGIDRGNVWIMTRLRENGENMKKEPGEKAPFVRIWQLMDVGQHDTRRGDFGMSKTHISLWMFQR